MLNELSEFGRLVDIICLHHKGNVLFSLVIKDNVYNLFAFSSGFIVRDILAITTA